MGDDVIPGCGEIGKPNGAFRACCGRLWGLCTLLALGVGGLVGWFFVALLPILGLVIFFGLLFGWLCVSTMRLVARAAPASAGRDRHRAGVAVQGP